MRCTGGNHHPIGRQHAPCSSARRPSGGNQAAIITQSAGSTRLVHLLDAVLLLEIGSLRDGDGEDGGGSRVLVAQAGRSARDGAHQRPRRRVAPVAATGAQREIGGRSAGAQREVVVDRRELKRSSVGAQREISGRSHLSGTSVSSAMVSSPAIAIAMSPSSDATPLPKGSGDQRGSEGDQKDSEGVRTRGIFHLPTTERSPKS